MNPVKNNLVALGSAAVLAVYATGYIRTKAAADRFTERDGERRAGVPMTDHLPKPADSLPGVVATQPAALTDAPSPAASPTGKNLPSATTSAPADSATATKLATPAAATKVVAVVPVIDSIAMPVTVPPVTTNVAAAVTDTVTTQKDKAALKDGTYSGWGTSRHGDIQASVEIRDGRIINAWVSQCLTRYSCSRIARIIPQVVERQSAEVDYVSGATQSTNAYYYAIVEALAKAK